ncbi:MAG TPA: OPT/YSL family transporter, partial [Pirellulales bacterium]|nr:OPT/YSL family transporter [Pirellulales bacterium]
GRVYQRDNGDAVPNKFEAPKTKLMALIIDGILNRRLPWELVIIGALVAVVLELAGVPSLPFAVGVYLPIETSVPIFVGGMVRWLVERRRGPSPEAESSPGVLLGSGYIAGGAIGGVLIAFMSFAPKSLKALAVGERLSAAWQASPWPALAMFALLIGVLGAVAGRGVKSEK